MLGVSTCFQNTYILHKSVGSFVILSIIENINYYIRRGIYYIPMGIANVEIFIVTFVCEHTLGWRVPRAYAIL